MRNSQRTIAKAEESQFTGCRGSLILVRVLFVTDIHGSHRALEWLLGAWKGYDAIIVGGDVTSQGMYGFFSKFFTLLTESSNPIYFVLGNHDPRESMVPGKARNIHGRREKIGGFIVGGLGGSNITPFNTPFEISDDEARRTLSALKSVDILISHCPPFETKCDMAYGGNHVGSKPVREFVETSTPKIVLCGHIHESRGTDELKRSKIINPGPLLQGNYAVLNLQDEITVELNEQSDWPSEE
jgi:Icc-related predicted phosphoesterase